MVRDQKQGVKSSGDAAQGEDKRLSKYFVNFAAAEQNNRSLATLIAGRRCYMDQQADDVPASESNDAMEYVERITDHCGQTSDYLLPDTPLKEAMFRVLIAGGNEPMDAAEIGAILDEKWAMTPFPRDVSIRVIGRLLDNSDFYSITKIPEPEPEVPEEEEIVEAVPAPVDISPDEEAAEAAEEGDDES